MATRSKQKQNKDEVINVRCTSAQKQLISAAAERVGLGTGPWMLTLALREAVKDDPGAVDTRAPGRR